MSLTLEERLLAARLRLAISQPFFAYLTSHLRVRFTDRVKRAGVDRRGNLYVNPDYARSLSDPELVWMLAHEVCHPALRHFERRGGRRAGRWNHACDQAINLALDGAGLWTPDEMRPDPRFGGKAAEEIYDLLRDGEGEGGDDGDMIDDGDGGGEDDWRDRAAEAKSFAKSIGRLPEGVERLVDQMLGPRVSWRHMLWRYVAQMIPVDYCLHRPSRRAMALGLPLPGVRRETLRIAVAVDTSGSVSDRELDGFLSEVSAIVRSYDSVRATLLTCDARVHDVLEIGPDFDARSVKIRGRGGTDFRPVFDHLEREAPDCRLLVYLTDLMGTFPPSAPPFPVLWASTMDGRVPFGDVVRVREE